jgi:hypothetical protein
MAIRARIAAYPRISVEISPGLACNTVPLFPANRRFGKPDRADLPRPKPSRRGRRPVPKQRRTPDMAQDRQGRRTKEDHIRAERPALFELPERFPAQLRVDDLPSSKTQRHWREAGERAAGTGTAHPEQARPGAWRRRSTNSLWTQPPMSSASRARLRRTRARKGRNRHHHRRDDPANPGRPRIHHEGLDAVGAGREGAFVRRTTRGSDKAKGPANSARSASDAHTIGGAFWNRIPDTHLPAGPAPARRSSCGSRRSAPRPGTPARSGR